MAVVLTVRTHVSCKVSLEKLSEYLTSVEAGRPSRLAPHIAKCDECGRRLEALLAVGNLLSDVPAAPVPDDLWENISPRLEPRKAPNRRTSPSLKRLATFAGVSGVVAAAVLAAGVYFTPSTTDDLEAFSGRHVAVATAAGLIQDLPPQNLLAQVSDQAGFQVRYPKDIPDGWKLTGGDTFNCPMGRKVSHLVFQNGEDVLSVFQKVGGGPGMGMGRGGGGNGFGGGRGGNRWRGQRQGGLDNGPLCRAYTVAGQPMAVCTDGQFRFTVTGDLPAQELEIIAKNLAASR